MTVALIRQGLGELLDEEDVDLYDPVFKLGFTLGEDGKEKALDALRKKVERRDATIERLQAEVEELRSRPEPKPEPEPEPLRHPEPTSEKNAFAEAWFRSPILDREEFAREYYAGNPVQEPEPEPEPDAAPAPLKFQTIKERNAAIVEYLENHSTAETAEAFGINESLVRNVKCRAKKLENAS